jgi:hypothetical protein
MLGENQWEFKAFIKKCLLLRALLEDTHKNFSKVFFPRYYLALLAGSAWPRKTSYKWHRRPAYC